MHHLRKTHQATVQAFFRPSHQSSVGWRLVDVAEALSQESLTSGFPGRSVESGAHTSRQR